MKILPLVFILSGVPAFSQASFATIKSTATYDHGTLLPYVVDATRNVNVRCNIKDAIRSRYLRVFVGVHDTSPTDGLDFLPSQITLTAPGLSPVYPMNADEVLKMAKGTARRQMFGILAATAVLDFANSRANARNHDLQVYEQIRTDDMVDAAMVRIGTDFVQLQERNLLHTTVFPQSRLMGYVYFDLGKNGGNRSHSEYTLRIPIGTQVYEMDFDPLSGGSNSLVGIQSPAQVMAESIPQVSAPVVAVAQPVKKTTTVQIAAGPYSAEIELDGQYVGDTPSQFELPEGDHVLRLTRERYQPWERKLHTAGGGNVNVNAELKSQTVVYHTR